MVRVTVLLRNARLLCLSFSAVGIVMYSAASSKMMISISTYSSSWLVLLLQIIMCVLLMCVIPFFMEMPMPPDLQTCIYYLFLDWVAASFTFGMGSALVMIAWYVMPTYDASVYAYSLVYGCVMMTAGAFAVIGFLFNMLLTAKLQTPAQQ